MGTIAVGANLLGLGQLQCDLDHGSVTAICSLELTCSSWLGAVIPTRLVVTEGRDLSSTFLPSLPEYILCMCIYDTCMDTHPHSATVSSQAEQFHPPLILSSV